MENDGGSKLVLFIDGTIIIGETLRQKWRPLSSFRYYNRVVFFRKLWVAL